MTYDDFLDKQYKLAVQAGMNQRYHQLYATFWRRLDAWVKIATAAAAVISGFLSVATVFQSVPQFIVWASLVVSIITTIAAVALNVLPFGGYERDHRDLFRQWTDLREDIEALLFECDGEPSPQVLCEMKKLESKAHRICGMEPAPNKSVLDQCCADEEKSRHEECDDGEASVAAAHAIA